MIVSRLKPSCHDINRRNLPMLMLLLLLFQAGNASIHLLPWLTSPAQETPVFMATVSIYALFRVLCVMKLALVL
jgi:hypothetical protein